MSNATTVKRLLDRFDQSFASGDLDVLAELFSDDAVVFFHAHPVTGRSAPDGLL